MQPRPGRLRRAVFRGDFGQSLPHVVDDTAADDPALQGAHRVVEEQPVHVERVGQVWVLGIRVENEELEARVEVVGGIQGLRGDDPGGRAHFRIEAHGVDDAGDRAIAAQAEDEWSVIAEQTIKSADQGAEVESSGGRRDQNVKEVKVSVDGADVNIKKLVLHWNNANDDEITDIGMLKAGGSSLPIEAPGRKGQLKSATVTYEFTGADTAVLKVWGR